MSASTHYSCSQSEKLERPGSAMSEGSERSTSSRDDQKSGSSRRKNTVFELYDSDSDGSDDEHDGRMSNDTWYEDGKGGSSGLDRKTLSSMNLQTLSRDQQVKRFRAIGGAEATRLASRYGLSMAKNQSTQPSRQPNTTRNMGNRGTIYAPKR